MLPRSGERLRTILGRGLRKSRIRRRWMIDTINATLRRSVHQTKGGPKMTSQPIRDPIADHLLTPQNSALLIVDYQPPQLSAVKSIDRDLLMKNAASTIKAVQVFGAPIVH